MKTIYHNPLNGEETAIVRSSSETGGEYSLLEVKLIGGGKNPLHYHLTFTEEFETLVGNLHLGVGKETIVLRPGERLKVEKKVRHRFYNPSAEPITFRVKLVPGQPGFENFIKATFGLINDGKTTSKQIPKNILHAAVLLKWGDTHLPNFLFKVGEPILNYLYKLAVKNGVEKQLKNNYCS